MHGGLTPKTMRKMPLHQKKLKIYRGNMGTEEGCLRTNQQGPILRNKPF